MHKSYDSSLRSAQLTKTVVNRAYDNMGRNNTQMFTTFFDGVAALVTSVS